ncbi:MAG: hypothetical protein ACTSXN_10060 [Promethearchaeota archaeon]
MPQFLYLGFEVVYFLLGILSMINTLRSWRENKNRILIAISIYVGSVLMRSILDMVTYSADLNLDFIIAGTLTFGQVIGNVLFIIQVEFVLYLKKQTKFYTVPFIISFYLIVGRILVDSAIPFIIYAMIVSYGSAFNLIKDGRKKRNGLAIGMGLFFLLFGIGQTINIEIGFVIFKAVAMLTLYLGTRGFYEKYVWPDVKMEEKVLTTWISKLVIKE